MGFFSVITLVKISFTMAAVLGLSLVAERISARAAGVLAGFPHGIAIVLYFIGIEQGVEFAAEAARFAIAGLSANVVLAYVYAQLAHWRVLWASIGALAAFLGTATLLRIIAPGPGMAALLTLVTAAVIWVLLQKTQAEDHSKKPKVKPAEMLLRALFAALIVVLITGGAALVGPGWAGLLAGFPVVTFPLLVIIHARHGAIPIRAIVRHYPFGLLSLLAFTLTVSWGFSALGIGLGTLLGLAVALVFLTAASFLKTRIQTK